MRFSDVPELEPLLLDKPPAIQFTGVQCDSRRVRPGDLFIAVTGKCDDGAKYGAVALAKGAVAVVSEMPLRECGKATVLVKDARQAQAILACAINGWPGRKMEVFGITGTNGKTTTAWLLHEMLSEYGQQVGLITTVQVSYLNRVIPAVRTTPDACELQAQLAAMANAGCHSAVMEVSSHALISTAWEACALQEPLSQTSRKIIWIITVQWLTIGRPRRNSSPCLLRIIQELQPCAL
jgi:UDP-N-acetylmuramoyl-L-alanyl-D-glutamate--2,6-diaminopimelate ligase